MNSSITEIVEHMLTNKQERWWAQKSAAFFVANSTCPEVPSPVYNFAAFEAVIQADARTDLGRATFSVIGLLARDRLSAPKSLYFCQYLREIMRQ